MGRKASKTRSSTSSRTPGSSLAAVILAAGEGTRMKSSLPKVLQKIAGRSLVEHVTRAAFAAGAEEAILVVGFGADEVEKELLRSLPGAKLRFVRQTERLGTADAVLRATRRLSGFKGEVLILCGDVPALPSSALRSLLGRHRRTKAALSILTAELGDPAGYGRIVRGSRGEIREIVEHKDATKEQLALNEINTGTYCAHWPSLLRALRKIKPDNIQGEYYLTDAVRLLLAQDKKVSAVIHAAPEQALGINSRAQLSLVGRQMNRSLLEILMTKGVSIIDPDSTWVHAGVTIGRDTVIHPGVTLEGSTRIGKECVVRSGSRLTDVVVGNRVTLLEGTIAIESAIGHRTKVGPFAHLRPGTVLGLDCKVGNFVETKKAVFGTGSKASHLSYIGDASLGKSVNIGAGTICCNYDGVNKHRTELDDGVFIGSDTQLVAPVRVGKGSYVGAGTTLTHDVPAGALALSRAEQKIVEGWVARKKARQAKQKRQTQKTK